MKYALRIFCCWK